MSYKVDILNKNIKARLLEGDAVYGTWCLLPSPEVINVLAKSGLDFVLIDMEHGPMDFSLAQKMVMAAQSEGCEAIIRVPKNDESYILRALDSGADGVIVPHVQCIEDRVNALSYMKYPPIGKRGYSPYTRAGGYVATSDYTILENRRNLSAIIIEGKEGIDNIDEIINDDNLDVVYIGTYDISMSLGVPGRVWDDEVISILKKCVLKINNRGKVAGCLFHTDQERRKLIDMGIKFLAYKVDSSVLYDGYKFMLDKF